MLLTWADPMLLSNAKNWFDACRNCPEKRLLLKPRNGVGECSAQKKVQKALHPSGKNAKHPGLNNLRWQP